MKEEYLWPSKEDIWILSVLRGDELGQIEPDWKKLIEKARRESLAPLIYLKTVELNPAEMPSLVKEELREMYLATLARQSRIAMQLVELIKTLRKAGIEVVLYKGAALWTSVYSDITARPVTDVDLLMRKKDLPEIEKIFRAAGFEREKEYDLTPFTNHIGFYKDRSLIEVRWDLKHCDRLRFLRHIGVEEIFENSHTVLLNGVEVKVPSPTYQLVLSIVHLSIIHNFEFEIWLYDLIAIILRHADAICWDEVANLAEKYRIKRALCYSFFRATKLFGPVSIPDEFSEDRISSLRLFLLNSCVNRRLEHFSKILIFDGIADIFRYTFAIIFPSKVWLKWRYRSKVPAPALYIARPFILFFSVVRRTLLQRACWEFLPFVRGGKEG